MTALSHFPRAAYGRFKVRFKLGHGISAFHDGEGIDIVDISDVGFKLKNDGRFEEGKAFFFEFVFQDGSDISGWHLHTQCRWVSADAAGFIFLLDGLGQSVSALISRQHLSGRLKVLNGIEL